MIWVGLLLALLGSGAPAHAEEPEAVGRFVTVPSSLSGGDVSRLLAATKVEFDRFKIENRSRPLKDQQVFKIIFDFTPEPRKVGNSDDFALCLKLATGIRELQQSGAQTTAYVHGEVSRHTVLPVLACQHVVMSQKAKLGPVVADSGKPANKFETAAYEELAVRLNGNPDLVRKLFDRDVSIVPSKQGGWVDARKLDEVAGGRAPLFERGDAAVFDFAKAKLAGLCELDARESRQELADAYQLPRSALQEDSLLERIVAWKITLSGEVTSATKEQLERRIRKAIAHNANLIIFELRCHGGDTAAANNIAKYLVSLNDDRKDRPVMTIGFVTPDAQDTATVIALGCTYIVMDAKKDSEGRYLASLGGFGKLLAGQKAEDARSIGDGLEELAKLRNYPPVLARGFVDRSGGEQLFYVKSAKGTREWAVMTDRQLDEERKERPGHWQLPGTPIPMDEQGFVRLRADDARNHEVRDTVPTALSLHLAYKVSSLEDLYKDYGLEPSDVKESGADWLDDMADFLRQEYVQMMLVMIGITCLILELKMPGVGLPGILAAICFVLFFWSGSKDPNIAGSISWLAVLLFLLGLIFLAIEIFVLPGFGVCGISGVVLILGSLALMTYGKWPADGSEWLSLSRKLAPFGMSLMGSVVLAILLVRYLPSIPYINRILLKPQVDEDSADVPLDPAQAKLAALLGAIGVAATPLRPAGKVQFGEEFVDVVAEGSYVVPGTRVQVIEIEGNRVVVKAV
jgi:membrane-bound ClpP family serine protease